ncbi:MAG: hypothetical protein WC703_00965 [Candidatus Neomarinimicrobiota bacterium]
MKKNPYCFRTEPAVYALESPSLPLRLNGEMKCRIIEIRKTDETGSLPIENKERLACSYSDMLLKMENA